jgi:ppGpp synthetase/RelA/SpoT-type nucleotidyltranferase
MASEIDLVVERLFPAELVALEGFNDWCSQIRQDVQPAAADLIARLELFLDKTLPACSASCHPRKGCWDRFGGDGEKAIKSIASIRSKLARDLMTEPITSERKSEAYLKHEIFKFSDLGRVRLVADFPFDVRCLRDKLFVEEKFLGEYLCPKGIKDFVFDPAKRDGLKGHRARQFSVRAPLDGATDFGFEVQLMTRLQHAWDQRNHPLYEWQREHPNWKDNEVAVELAVNDFACAEALHLVDQQADRNQRDLQEFIRKEQSA